LGELGELGAVAGVTSSTPLVLTAPFTWSWASCSFSTASWLSSAVTSAADDGFDWSELTWASIEAICWLSWVFGRSCQVVDCEPIAGR
jgi:hypothetical protein